jgi:hypothetical protein
MLIVDKDKAAKADNNPSNPTLTLEPAPSSVAGPAIGPRPHDPTKKQRPSHAFSLDFDSDSSLTPPLEDEQGKPAASASKPKEAKGESKPKTQAGKQSVKAKDGKPAPKGKRTTKVKGGLIVEKKDTPKGKGKKTDTAKPVEKKPRAKPIKKAEKPVEPPIFEKVDTRLGRVEAEQKIMVSHDILPLLTLSYESTCIASDRSCRYPSVHYHRSKTLTDRRPRQVSSSLPELCSTSSRKS